MELLFVAHLDGSDRLRRAFDLTLRAGKRPEAAQNARRLFSPTARGGDLDVGSEDTARSR